MKKYISLFIVAALIFTMFAGIGGTALAAGVTLSIEPGSVKGTVGATYDLTATINTDIAITGYQVVRVDNGQICGDPIEAPLLPGSPGNISFQLTIEEGMGGGDVAYKVQYKTETEDWKDGGTASVHVEPLIPKIACTATPSQTQVDPGGQITISFEIQNQGDLTLENIEVKADNLNKGNAIFPAFSLNPGETTTKDYKYTFSTPITFEPYITYTVIGAPGETLKYEEIEPITLTQTIREVHTSLSVDNSRPEAGQEVTFTLNITNEGTMSYTSLSVSWNGEDIGAPARSLSAPADLEKQYKMKFDASTDVYFTVTMKDSLGQTKSLHTNTIHILLPIDTKALESGLKIVIEPDRDEFTSAGVVNFSGYISNDSDYTLSDVSVTEPSLDETIFTISEMAPGTKQSISCSVDINKTTTYNFLFSAKDRNGDPYEVKAEPVTVTIQGSETATPNPGEEAVDVTLPPANASSDPLLIWFIIAGILIVLIIGVGAALFILWRNGRSPSRASRPMASKAKRPLRGGYKKSVKSRSFKDRNNF